ncbi:MAG: peptide chain release factor N(5)-glutamine methyltransferase [Candidatus Firestonebacteria bacterium]
MTIKDAITFGTKVLESINIENARFESEIILAHILNIKRYNLYLNFAQELSKLQSKNYSSYINKRKKHIPLQYLLKSQEFMDVKLYIDKGVLIPRPETEILVEKFIELVKNKSKKIKILDIGTGSGNIAIMLALNLNCVVYAADISVDALKIAKYNAKQYKVSDKIKFIQADILNLLPTFCDFDAVISNPPYIKSDDIDKLSDEVSKYEPRIALDGGKDGLLFYKSILSKIKKILKPNGIIAFEIGMGQKKHLLQILNQLGNFTDIKFIKDYQSIDRVVFARMI